MTDVRSSGGRPATDTTAAALAGADVLVDASRGDAVRANIEAALDAGVRRFVIATTGWAFDRAPVEVEPCASRRVGRGRRPNFSLGVGAVRPARRDGGGAVRRASTASTRTSSSGTGERSPTGRPGRHSTWRAGWPLGTRTWRRTDDLEVVSIRAGASPGMHLVGFDAVGETVELRLTARDRSAYAAGILAAADWLGASPRPAGIHPFDPVVDELLAARPDDVAA